MQLKPVLNCKFKSGIHLFLVWSSYCVDADQFADCACLPFVFLRIRDVNMKIDTNWGGGGIGSISGVKDWVFHVFVSVFGSNQHLHFLLTETLT